MGLRHILLPVVLATAGATTLAGTASAAPTNVGIETFTLVTDIESEGGTVTAAGVIDDTGVDIVVSDTEDIFDFGANGQITVFHSPVRQHDHFSQKKCEFRFMESGTYVFGNGTGQWADYNGSGTYTLKAQATNVCDSPPVGTLTITARGPINLAANQ